MRLLVLTGVAALVSLLIGCSSGGTVAVGQAGKIAEGQTAMLWTDKYDTVYVAFDSIAMSGWINAERSKPPDTSRWDRLIAQGDIHGVENGIEVTVVQFLRNSVAGDTCEVLLHSGTYAGRKVWTFCAWVKPLSHR